MGIGSIDWLPRINVKKMVLSNMSLCEADSKKRDRKGEDTLEQEKLSRLTLYPCYEKGYIAYIYEILYYYYGLVTIQIYKVRTMII